jgi:hypothetical protein
MKSIIALVDHTLTWNQPKTMKFDYELHFGGNIVATMKFPKMLSSTAVGQSGDGSWIFERKGAFNTRIIVTQTETGTQTGVFTPQPFKGGGIVQLEKGKQVLLRHNFWKSIFELTTEEGESLVQFTSHGFFRQIVDVQINRRALQYRELPWLVMLAFYIILLGRRDAAAHAAVS